MDDSQIQIFSRFNALEQKLRVLVENYTEMKRAFEETKEDNENLRKVLNETLKENQELQKKLNQQVKNFKKSDKFTKIAVSNLKSTGNPVQLKEKLDEYILEIEKCINQLSN
jgi:regulator of replication initiation timing